MLPAFGSFACIQVKKLPVSRSQFLRILLYLHNQFFELLARDGASAEKGGAPRLSRRGSSCTLAFPGAAAAAASINAMPSRKASSFAMPKPRSRLRKV